jgi:choline dehydrogenase-like flavoprotein
VLPHFLAHEDDPAGAGALHAEGGEWKVRDQRLHWDVLDDVRDACVEAGLPETDDFNTGDNHGVGYFKVNQSNGWRWNTASAFLRPAEDRPNLTVHTKALARRVLFDGARATGLAYRRDGVETTASARREVILSAGAIGSPHLLQLSGIGPGEVLQDLGIDVLRDVPAIGGNLQDHLQLRCAYKVQGAVTLNTLSATLWGKARIAAEYALFRSGPMSMAPSQLGAFARSRPDVETPDLEYHIQPLSLTAFGQPLDPFDAITLSVCHLRPESRGTVRPVTPEAGDAPEIAPNYLSTPGDRQVAADAIRLTRQIAAQPALARYRPEEMRPGIEAQSPDELEEAAGQIGTTIFHPVGTVAMGGDGAPLDPRLRLRGVEGLRVVDASVMPTITSGNTNAPTIMIAEKAAAMIREDAR